MEDEMIELLKKSEESLDKSLENIIHCQELGNDTLQSLHKQGDKIASLRTEINKLKIKHKEADKKLKSIENPMGWLINKVSFTSHEYNVKHTIVKSSKKKLEKNNYSYPSCSQEIQKLAPDIAPTLLSHTQTIDNKLDSISSICDVIKIQAIEMGQVLKCQIQDVEKLQKEIIYVENKIDKNNRKIENIL